MVDKQENGEVAERLKAHAWKACLGKPNVGSNPTLSAMLQWIETWKNGYEAFKRQFPLIPVSSRS